VNGDGAAPLFVGGVTLWSFSDKETTRHHAFCVIRRPSVHPAPAQTVAPITVNRHHAT
jgi:hypothetical protein